VAVGPPPATDPHYEDDFEKKILELVNKERKTAGLNPVKSSQGLNDAAQVRARELTESFSHTRPNGSAYDTAIKIPYMVSGENIAIGQKTPQQVMEAWMNSPGHRDNILNPYWTHLGAGCWHDSSRSSVCHWAQIFGLIPSSEKFHNEAYDQELFRLINGERTTKGLELLVMTDATHDLAQRLAAYYSQHKAYPAWPDLGIFSQVVFQGSWGPYALDTPQMLFSRLRDTCGNIIDGGHTHLGIGYYHNWEGNSIHWWAIIWGPPGY
jgi:uncharacterized protein YkwD